MTEALSRADGRSCRQRPKDRKVIHRACYSLRSLLRDTMHVDATITTNTSSLPRPSFSGDVVISSQGLRRRDEEDACHRCEEMRCGLVPTSLFQLRPSRGSITRRMDSILVRRFYVLPTSISRQSSMPPSRRRPIFNLQQDQTSLVFSLFSSRTPSNVRSSLLEHVLATSPIGGQES